jgi:hypothetical protein
MMVLYPNLTLCCEINAHMNDIIVMGMKTIKTINFFTQNEKKGMSISKFIVTCNTIKKLLHIWHINYILK